jgi:hypothetical protein
MGADLGANEYIPGWMARGYPGYTGGFAWYRLRVNVHSSQGGLAIKMPDEFDDAYQLFVDGQLTGQFGKFGKHGVTAYSSLPSAFKLPHEVTNGVITIAVRMWMDRATPFSVPDAGGMHEPPVLGHAGVIQALVGRDQKDLVVLLFAGCLEMLILLLALTVAVMLFWMDRTEVAYLWLGLVCAVGIFNVGLVLNMNFAAWIGLIPGILLLDVICVPLRIGLWVIFWGY